MTVDCCYSRDWVETKRSGYPPADQWSSSPNCFCDADDGFINEIIKTLVSTNVNVYTIVKCLVWNKKEISFSFESIHKRCLPNSSRGRCAISHLFSFLFFICR